MATRAGLSLLCLFGLGAAEDFIDEMPLQFCEMGEMKLEMPSGGSGKCYCGGGVEGEGPMNYCSPDPADMMDDKGEYLNAGCDSEQASDERGMCGYYCQCGWATSEYIGCCLRAPGQAMMAGTIVSKERPPLPASAETGGLCEEVRNQGEGNCTQDWRAACVEGSLCRGLIATALEVCSDLHYFWREEDWEWKNSKMDVMEAQHAIDGTMCTECGMAFMEFDEHGCMESEGEGMVAACQEGSTCAGLLFQMNQTCDASHVLPGDDMAEEYSVLDMLRHAEMACGPCMPALAGLEAACGDSPCDEHGPCAQQKALIHDVCPADFSFPNEETGEEMSIGHLMEQLEMMCGDCMQAFMQYSETCSDRSGEVCMEGSHCYALLTSLPFVCRPGFDSIMEVCMEHGEDSCECAAAGDSAFCESPDGMMHCGHICGSGYMHPSCKDEMSCGCQLARNENFCELCESEMGCGHCDSDCGLKGLADYSLFVLSSCDYDGGDHGTGPRRCVTIPGSHPMWYNEVWNRFTPRHCDASYPSPSNYYSPSYMYNPSPSNWYRPSPSYWSSPSMMYPSPSSWSRPSPSYAGSPSMMYPSPSMMSGPSPSYASSPSMMYPSPSMMRNARP